MPLIPEQDIRDSLDKDKDNRKSPYPLFVHHKRPVNLYRIISIGRIQTAVEELDNAPVVTYVNDYGDNENWVRPLHEFCDGRFWWAEKPIPEGNCHTCTNRVIFNGTMICGILASAAARRRFRVRNHFWK